jgi:peptide/nickel transport system substrate-binding protein
MQRILSIALVALFAGAALAGCASNNGGGNGDGNGDGDGGGAAPQAIASYSPLTPLAGQPVNFTASGAGSNTVTWQFGDGTNASGATVSHVYAAPGQYVVLLNVSNARGESATNQGALTFVTVSRAETDQAAALAPVAQFTLDRQSLRPGESVNVNASASYALAQNPQFNETLGITPGNVPFVRNVSAITSYAWDFGDGSAPVSGGAATAIEANHTYQNPGLYPIRLTVTDNKGANSTYVGTVVVAAQAAGVGGYKHKDLYVTATISGPQSFDPGFDYETSGGNVIEQVYETLFGTDRGNTERIVPVLAAEVPTRENGGISEDGLTYTIKLRQGVRFHDNTEFDANAVKFSLDRLVLLNDPSSGAPVVTAILKGADDYRANATGTAAERAAYLALNTVEVVDKYTVRIHLPKPDAAVFQRLSFYASSIVSPTAFKAAHSERTALWGVPTTPDGLPPATLPGGTPITRDPWADTHMVGTGPFKLRTWLPGDRVILDRFDGHWAPTKPALKTVIIQYVDDLNTRILMFRNGDADEIYIPTSEVDRVRPTIASLATFIPADTLIVDQMNLNFNVKDPANCPKAGGAPKCDLFSDPKVREGVVYGFNYQSFFDNIWQGRAKPLAGVIPRGMPGYDESLQPYTFDAARAKAAFAASACSGGCEFDVYYNTGNTVREKAAQLLKDSLEGLGANIKVTPRGLPFNQLLDKAQRGEIPVQIAGWSPDYIATDDYIVPYFSANGYFPQQTSFRDAEMQAKIDAALAETDPVKQAEAFKEVNRMGVEKFVYMYLDQRSQVHVQRAYVQGYYYDPLHSGSPNTGDYSTISKA